MTISGSDNDFKVFLNAGNKMNKHKLLWNGQYLCCHEYPKVICLYNASINPLRWLQVIDILNWVLGKLNWGRFPTEKNKIKPNYSPPGPRSLGQLPIKTITNPVKPLIRTNTYNGGELSRYVSTVMSWYKSLRIWPRHSFSFEVLLSGGQISDVWGKRQISYRYTLLKSWRHFPWALGAHTIQYWHTGEGEAKGACLPSPFK